MPHNKVSNFFNISNSDKHLGIGLPMKLLRQFYDTVSNELIIHILMIVNLSIKYLF